MRSSIARLKSRATKKALKKKVELVLVAGGDGTVGKIARRLVGSGVPLSVLPFGTANNLARTLGFADSTVEGIVASLAEARYRSFDIGCVSGASKRRYFLEGAGGGLFADYLRQRRAAAEKRPQTRSSRTGGELKQHILTLRRMLKSYKPREWQMKLDGEDISGRYLIVEAMNIRAVGPVLTLAPQAKTDDGSLDLAIVRDEDRRLLCDFLEARLTNSQVEFPIPARPFRHLEICWDRAPLHLDDRLWPKKAGKRKGPRAVAITAEPAALTILLPSAARRRRRR
jgi:diacylglycerol kinase family enzyme